MTNKTYSDVKKTSWKFRITKSLNVFSFFIFYFSSSGGLIQNCMNLPQRFSHKTAAIYSDQCTTPLLFHNFKVIKTLETTQFRTMALFGMQFSYLNAVQMVLTFVNYGLLSILIVIVIHLSQLFQVMWGLSPQLDSQLRFVYGTWILIGVT